MIIDFHVHISPPDLIKDWRKIGEKEEYFRLLSESPVNKFATAEDILEEMDKSKVDKAVIFGFAFNDLGLCRYVNDYVADTMKKYPDRFIGFISISPNSKGFINEIDRCLDMGFKGLGELYPDGQGFDIAIKSQTSNLAYACIERDLPLIVHTNTDLGRQFVGKTATTPIKASKFAENFSQLKIVFAHWGGGLIFYELMADIYKQNKNVYYDTAASTLLYNKNIYKVARDIGVLDKVLFGSDFPLIGMDKFIDEIKNSGLNIEEEDMVLGNNSRSLLNL